MPFLYRLSDIVALLLFRLFRYRRKVVFENLRNSFPEKSEKEINLIAKKFYSHLADLLVEAVKMPLISQKEITKRVHFKNPELLQRYAGEGKSLIAVVGHYCNWEWGGLALGLISPHKVLGIYKPLSNKKWDQFIFKTRSRFGLHPIAMKETLRELIRRKNELTMTVFIADQTPVKHEIQYWARFLNRQTPVFLGIEKMAKQTGYPVIYCDMQRIKRGYYEVEFVTLAKQPELAPEYEVTDTHVKFLEDIIRKKPEYWLWSHRRWKHRQDT